MKIETVKNDSKILIGEYPFHDKLREELLPLLESFRGGIGPTNVEATHTEWDWMPNNPKVQMLKKYLCNEAYNNLFPPGLVNQDIKYQIICYNFWGNIYRKGDYARSHHHLPAAFYSFAYFLKSEWYHPPLILNDSGKRIRPKEGRYIIFPAYLIHSVPKHRFNKTRITISGNIKSVEVK